MRGLRWMALLALVAQAGCRPDNGLAMGKVYGTVTYKGEPLGSGQVLFTPDDSKGTTGVPAMAKINSDGTYELSTQDPGDGAIVGFHKVGIRGLELDPSAKDDAAEAPKTGKELFAARAKAVRNNARRSAKANAENVTVAVNGKSYRLVTPSKVANPNESGVTVEVARGSNRINLAIKEDGTVAVSK